MFITEIPEHIKVKLENNTIGDLCNMVQLRAVIL